MSGALLVCGATSDAGKSVLVTGLCRWLHRQGVSVAPFKAQNMALNSAVTADGAEIGRAQYAQALAAGATPEAAMNPILIKPTGEHHSQVVVNGHPAFDADARTYHRRRTELLPVVLDALSSLRSRYDVVIAEGAGSPTEINLRPFDVTNMALARAANLPVMVVGDIDRGGVFAALYGTIALLEAADQALIAGVVVNQFRGDPGVLAPGLEQFATLTGRPCLGVLPHVDGIEVDAEDSLALRRGFTSSPPVGPDRLHVAVVRLPRISNVTDVDALAAEPGVTVHLTDDPAAIQAADLAIVPGSKHTVGDLQWLRRQRLDAALTERAAAGRPVLAVCGGYQMLGTDIVDDVESRAGRVSGLGLLPVRTVFAADKVLAQRSGKAPDLDATAGGYEIRHGRVRRDGGSPWLVGDDGIEEGCRVGETWGTSWHGLLEHDDLRRTLLRRIAGVAGKDWRPGNVPFAAVRARRHDVLGDLVADHLDTAAVERLLRDGAPPGLPTLAPAGAPPPRALPDDPAGDLPGHLSAPGDKA